MSDPNLWWRTRSLFQHTDTSWWPSKFLCVTFHSPVLCWLHDLKGIFPRTIFRLISHTPRRTTLGMDCNMWFLRVTCPMTIPFVLGNIPHHTPEGWLSEGRGEKGWTKTSPFIACGLRTSWESCVFKDKQACLGHTQSQNPKENVTVKHSEFILAISVPPLGPVPPHGFQVSILQLQTKFSVGTNFIKVMLHDGSPTPTSFPWKIQLWWWAVYAGITQFSPKRWKHVQSRASRQVKPAARSFQDSAGEGSSPCKKRSKLATLCKIEVWGCKIGRLLRNQPSWASLAFIIPSPTFPVSPHIFPSWAYTACLNVSYGTSQDEFGVCLHDRET